MCGIVGIVAVGSQSEIAPETIREMGGAIAHRGPDDEGYFFRPRVALGNRRLSIIDLEHGKQPISTPDKRYTIVYNGEVFNYKELRKELQVKEGKTFRTESDTEVVLQGYVTHGDAFLDRLEGMFAFLIYDSKEELVIAARDAFGVKPLYFYRSSSFVYFASEIRAIRKVHDKPFAANQKALSGFLQCGYVAGRETLFQGVERLSPGSVLIVGSDGKTGERAFSKRLHPSHLATVSRGAFDLKKTLIRAIDRSLVADVPVGIYLSGGVDSSLMAAIIRKELDMKLASFSVCFPANKKFDEGGYAKAVAKDLDLEHFTIDCHPEDFEDVASVVRALEEPLADPNAIPLGRLSELARKHLKVVVGGEGGDELFGGYNRYFWDRFVSKYQELPGFMRWFAENVALRLGGERMRRRARKLVEGKELSRSQRYLSWFSAFGSDERASMLMQESNDTEKLFNAAFEFAAPLSPLSQVQWVDLVTFLRDDLLVKADKMSMLHSLEVRVPFLQSDVAHAAFALKEEERITGKQTKVKLRSLLAEYLSPEIVGRKKQGFEVPLGDWFRGRMKPLQERYLSKEAVESRGWFRWETVDAIRKENDEGRNDRGLALFSLVMLEAWAQEHSS